MTSIAQQAARDVSPDAMAQDLIASYGLEQAKAIVAEVQLDRVAVRTNGAFWSDVATLLRLETQSDESENAPLAVAGFCQIAEALASMGDDFGIVDPMNGDACFLYNYDTGAKLGDIEDEATRQIVNNTLWDFAGA